MAYTTTEAAHALRTTYWNHLHNEAHRLAKCLPNQKALRVKFEQGASEIYKQCPDPYDIEKAAPFMLELMKLYQRMVALHEHKEANKENAQSRYQPRRKNGWLSST